LFFQIKDGKRISAKAIGVFTNKTIYCRA